MLAQFDALHDRTQAMVDYNMREGEGLSRRATTSYAAVRATVLGLLALALLLGALAGWFISRYITGTLAEVSGRMETLQSLCVTSLGHAIEAMERGDLTAEIVTGTAPLNIGSADEIGATAATFNSLLGNVQEMVVSFRATQASLSVLIRRLQQSATHVGAASGSLAGTAKQVGAATEQVAATMHEVAQASEQSACGAREVAQGSTNQARALGDGTERLRHLVDAISGVAGDASAAMRVSREAAEAAAVGVEAVGLCVVSMDKIQQTVTESAQVVLGLGESQPPDRRHRGDD